MVEQEAKRIVIPSKRWNREITPKEVVKCREILEKFTFARMTKRK